MNFDTEKPVVLHFVDLMRRAHDKRYKAMKRGVEWGCCDRYGSMYHINGIPRIVKCCPICKPLRGKYHRCKLYGYVPERYEKAKEWRRRMKNLNKLAKILMSNAADHPYKGSMTPLCDFRGSWENRVIEYYHRGEDTVLTVRTTGQPCERVEMNLIRAAFGVPANVEPDQKARDDGSYEDKFEWKPVKQMVLA